MKLSRIDRIQKVLDVATLFPQLDPATVTSVSVSLLPPLGRNGSPTAATTWTAYSVTAGAATVMFVGSDADSTGAVVVTATADLWAKASGSFGEVEAVLVERMTLMGSAAQIAAPLPIAPVLTVQGRTGAVVLSAADVGADASGAAAAAQTAAATDATTKVNAATTASALDAATATNVNSGAQTSAALRAAYVPRPGQPLQVTAGGLASAFDPGRSVYNLKSSQLTRYRAARAASQVGTARCRIACVGDSETLGTGSTDSTKQSWPRVASNKLTALGFTVASPGLAVLGYQNPADPRITHDAGWAPFQVSPTPEPVPLMSSTAAGTLTFTSTTVGTVVEVGYLLNSTAFTVSIDGGTAVSPPSGSAVPGTYVVTGLANTTHTVRLVAAGASVHLLWFDVRTDTGINLLNAGIGGSQASGWLGSDFYGARAIVEGWSPHLVILTLGTNDGFNGRTAQQYHDDLTGLATDFRTASDVILGAPVQAEGAPWDTYRPQLYKVADEMDLPLVDFGNRLGPYTTVAGPNGVYASDQVHPNEKGYFDLGTAITAVLAA